MPTCRGSSVRRPVPGHRFYVPSAARLQRMIQGQSKWYVKNKPTEEYYQ